MASPVPTPVAAAIGLLPAALEGARRLPATVATKAATKAVTLPVLAVSSALSGLDLARREYDDLAARGEALIARLRGQAVELAEDVAERADELEDRLEEVVERTPLAGAYDSVEDAVEDAAARVRSTARAAEQAVVDGAKELVETVPEAEQPKGVPTPKAVEPDATRVDTAASADVVAVVEQVTTAAPVPSHDELPLPDYDHMTLGSLRGRLRSLSLEQLSVVRAYEKAHADRLPIVTMLDNRVAKLATDAAAAPSGPVSSEPAPEQRATAGGPRPSVTPATAGRGAPAPRAGDATNPGSQG